MTRSTPSTTQRNVADASAAAAGTAQTTRGGSDPILEIAGLRKEFGTFTALHSIDLKVRNGEFLTIVGPSGSGKTTLIRLLVGMEEPTEGAILLRNQRIERVPANQRPTCMVFQSLALFPHRTVGENIEFPMKIRGEDKSARKARALELMELLHLPLDYYGKRIQACSGGERQRVALARALAFDPEILFFDEPLSALDYRLRKALEKELKDLHERTGKTFVYITHSLEEAMVMSDRVAIMRAGRFEQIATPDDIYARPKSRFVAEFMGDVNLFDITASGAPGIQFAPGIQPGAGALVVRPEAIRFLAPGEEAPAIVAGTLHGEYNLGSRIQFEIDRAEGDRLTVETLREARPGIAPGDPVRLGFDPATCHLIAEG
ncbi:ABC transporter ATP-binding protein [Rhodobacteraceae bacterium NNCM2]|nr:ABC transporter ATP-binding protein [Coraliihabitans acroporae]